MLQRGSRFFEKCSAGISQFDAASFAKKEAYIQLEFNRSYLLAQRRLLHTKAFRRPGDMAFLRHSNKVAQMP